MGVTEPTFLDKKRVSKHLQNNLNFRAYGCVMFNGLLVKRSTRPICPLRILDQL